MPSGRPKTSLPSSRKEVGKTWTIFRLPKFKLSSQSSSACLMSKLVTSPSALETIASPELASPRRLAPLTEMMARASFKPELFSAAPSASRRQSPASSRSITYPRRTPKVWLSPKPIILGYFSPLRNSPTTTRVLSDPRSIPIEIFLIVFFLRFLHYTAMAHSFQMKHSVDNQKTLEGARAQAEIFRLPFYNLRSKEYFSFVLRVRESQDIRRFVFFSVFFVDFSRFIG